jgi:hypothetical protein
LFVQLVMLVLQAAAFRRHGHKSFLILCTSSVFALIYSILVGISYVVPLGVETLFPLTAIGAIVGATGALLAIWGTVLLFRSYRNLAEVATQGSLGGA